MRKEQRSVHFSEKDIQKITKRFASFSENGCMTIDLFNKSMGLLGIGDAQYLSNRVFSLISNSSYCTCEEFVQFLDKINNGSFEEKLKLSFNYLDNQNNGVIRYSDIEVIINEISFVWNFLTGQKISTTESIQWLCQKLGISQHTSLSFNQYASKYDQEFNWFQFFNYSHQKSKLYENQKQYYTSIRNSSNEFKIDQIQEYIKLIHQEIEYLLHQFNQEQSFDQCSGKQLISQLSSSKKGPKRLTSQQFKPRGDYGHSYRQSLPYLNQQQLTKEIHSMHQNGNIYDIIANKLEQISDLSSKLFTNKHMKNNRERVVSRTTAEQQKKKILKNITKPPTQRRNIIYFGHQNWNIMLNMMLGVRRSLKSHYYKFDQSVSFSEEDLNCKYYHELIYKRNDKSIKQISQIFVDYSPKVFYYIRQYFDIDNNQFLKSIGLENLIGNLLMGNLSTLSDQTSQGKSGSFIYYTFDSRIIVKSISRQEYVKLRSILEDYTKYIKDNPSTYIMKIYGLYKMKNKSSNRSIYFIVIGNVFDRQIEIDERYDIKGATYNRQILQKEQIISQNHGRNKNIALKDMDLINNHNRTFDIEHDLKQKIFKQILKDAQFLKKHNIIEYSLLIGIHYLDQHQPVKPSKQISLFQRTKPKSNEILSKNKKQIYFFGIIDLLSEYTTARRFQNNFFTILNYDISCRDPQEYFERFKSFIYKYVFST